MKANELEANKRNFSAWEREKWTVEVLILHYSERSVYAREKVIF